MNYRHAYHAGNHADVLKHIVLALVIEHMTQKEKPFLFLDLHAGAGIYALDGVEAAKTGEWQSGVGKLWRANLACEDLIAPWRRAVAAVNPSAELSRYPGSPALAAHLMRAQDRLVLGELHPAGSAELTLCLGADPRVRVVAEDAAITIKAHLPPPERRAVILIDPPYELKDEAERTIRMLAQGLRRFATGQFLHWYPITGDGLDMKIKAEVAAMALPNMVTAELLIRTPRPSGGLAGSGLIMVNPPWTLGEQLRRLLPELTRCLSTPPEARWSVNSDLP